MGQNKMSDSEREAYRREQARQRRRMEEKQKKTVQGNPAKSVAKGGKAAVVRTKLQGRESTAAAGMRQTAADPPGAQVKAETAKKAISAGVRRQTK